LCPSFGFAVTEEGAKVMDDCKLVIVLRALNALIPDPRNARTHSRKQIRQLARSIETFGFLIPILTDQMMNIIAGHARWLAAKELGMEKVPVIQVEHLTEAQKRAYIIADNKLAQNASWDEDLLRVELEFLSQVDIDVDVDLTGFEIPEIDMIIGTANVPACEEPPLPPVPAVEDTVTRTGDLWQLRTHRIICGDCREPPIIDILMAGHQASMIITDPPYNVPIAGHVGGLGKTQHPEFAMASGEMSSEVFQAFLVTCFTQFSRISKDGSLHFVFMDWRHMAEILGAGRAVYDGMLNLCVWAKTNGGMGSLYRSQHELLFIFRHGSAPHINNVALGKYGRYRTNVWTYAGVNAFGKERDEALAMHPTVKPLQMIADAILDVTAQGDIVLDGFLGSGTAVLAAEQTSRVCYGVEIDPRYVDVVLRRWMHVSREQPVLVETGQTFDQVAAARAQTNSCEV